MRKRNRIFVVLLFAQSASAQFQALSESPYIGLSTHTGSNSNDSIAFEAHPTLKMPIFDNLNQKIGEYNKLGARNAFRLFFVFDPKIRMYNDTSMPIYMPSYKIFGSASWVHFDDPTSKDNLPTNTHALIFEHGHYSNGQDGCAMDSNSLDGSAACDEKYAKLNLREDDLRPIINRRNGEFSTNFIRLTYKQQHYIDFIDNNFSGNSLNLSISATELTRYLLWTKGGGYAERDAAFYSMHQFQLNVFFQRNHFMPCGSRIFGNQCLYDTTLMGQFNAGFEVAYFHSRNTYVCDYNFKLYVNYILPSGLGILAFWEHGQDDYNLRLVDNINRGFIGLTLALSTSEPRPLDLRWSGSR